MITGNRAEGYTGDDPFPAMYGDGYRAYNYCGFASLRSPLYGKDEEAVRKELAALRKKAEAAGIAVNQAHGPCPTDDSTPESRKANFVLVCKAIRGTAWLGARDLVLHPLLPHGTVNDAEPEVTYAMNLEWFRALLPIAKAYGIRLDLENMPYPGCGISRMTEVLRLVRDIGDADLGVCLDTGHASCIGDDPAGLVKEAGKSLYTLHVHDNDLLHDLHLVPFAGKIGWQDFRAALLETGFGGCVSLEIKLSQHMPESVRRVALEFAAKGARYIAGIEE